MELMRVIDTSLLGYVFKSPVATIAKQEVGLPFHGIRHLNENPFVADGLRGVRKMLNIRVNVTSDEQIEKTIPIIVSPSGACRKATNLEASFLCHIFEFAPTQIAIEYVVAVSGHV
jgi:hypothetical protein